MREEFIYLIPFVLAIGNRFRGSDHIYPSSTTLKRIIWFALPFSIITFFLYDYELTAKNILFFWFPLFLCAWGAYAFFGRPKPMENYSLMTLDGFARGVLLALPFLFYQQFEEAALLIASFSLQGIAYYLGYYTINHHKTKRAWLDEFTEWGELYTGFFIGCGLILGAILF